MSLLRRYKTEILCLLLFTVVYFSLRLYQLSSLPIFTDEAIYLHWAVVAKNDVAQRFISLTDGKQPLFVWLTVFSLSFFKDPLFAGRMVSVVSGLFTMIGLFFLGKELFRKRWIGLIAAAFYIFFPMAVFFDRMALYDSLVTTFCIWGLYVELLLVRYVRLDIALILGFVLGGGMLTKTNAFFTAAFLPFTLLFFDWQKKARIQRLFLWGFYAILAFVLAYMYYSILRLSPFFYIIDQKNHEFVLPFSEWINNPFIYFSGNMASFLFWILTYLTPPFVLLVLVGICFGKKHFKQIIFLVLCCVLPLVYLAFFGKIGYSRYLFFMITPLLIVAAFALVTLREYIRNSMLFIGLVLIISVWPLYTDYKILTDVAKAPIPKGDVGQYINGWAAGGGVKEAIAFFEKEGKNKKIYIATQGTFGLMPYALEIYLGKNQNIKTQGIWPIQDSLPQQVLEASTHMPTYFLFYQPCENCTAAGIAPVSLPLEKVLQVEKEKNISYLTVYKVITH